MSQQKKIRYVVLLAGIVVMFAGCGKKEMDKCPSDQPITLTLSHTDPENQITGQSASKFAELVESYTEGRVKVDIYPLGQLGTSSENCEGVQMGTIDMTILMPSMTGLICSDFNALDTPYIYADREECVKVNTIGTPAFDYLSNELEEQCGVKVLYSFYSGTRQFTSNKEIYAPEDLQGSNMRSLAFEVNTGLIDALGATAVQIDISELQQALSSGQVDGQENPVEVICTRQIYDYQKYLIMTNHMSYCQQMVINSDKWNSISEKDKASIMKAARETSDYINKIAFDNEDSYYDKLVNEYKMTIIDSASGLDIEAFRTQVSEYFQNKYGEKYKEIYSLIEKSK